ncbi:MAG: hypothetical protein WCV91_02950 [Candidatus Margulisiibacteriota bacterium]
MKKRFYGFLGYVFVFAVLAVGLAGSAQAEISVNINIGPPPIVVAAPVEVVMMPTGIYFVPGISFDVFFYNGYWWSPRGDRWYRSGQYNGPWGVIQRNYVPAYLFKVPKNYREVYKNIHPMNYGQWKKHYQPRAVNNKAPSSDRGQGKQHGNNKGHGGKH